MVMGCMLANLAMYWKKFLGNLYDTEIEFFRNDKGELVIFSSASDKLSIPVKN